MVAQPGSQVMRAEALPLLLDAALSSLAPFGTPEALSGGNLNFVWRLCGEGGSVVAKQAPPYIAGQPDAALDPARIGFETAALEWLGVERFAESGVSAPAVLHHDASRALLVMEDCGEGADLTDIDAGLLPALAGRVGRFIGRLHHATLDDADLARRFNNLPIQRARQNIQYDIIGELADRGGLANANEAGARAAKLGQTLLKPGRCLLMGDLWPPAVLVRGDALRLIDWEFAHFGQPLQDVAHFAAHLWMLVDVHADGDAVALREFLAAYQALAGPELTRSAVAIAMSLFLSIAAAVENTSAKSFHYAPGLAERSEGFILLSLMALDPAHLRGWTWLFAILIGVTAIQRLWQARKVLRDADQADTDQG